MASRYLQTKSLALLPLSVHLVTGYRHEAQEGQHGREVSICLDHGATFLQLHLRTSQSHEKQSHPQERLAVPSVDKLPPLLHEAQSQS